MEASNETKIVQTEKLRVLENIRSSRAVYIFASAAKKYKAFAVQIKEKALSGNLSPFELFQRALFLSPKYYKQSQCERPTNIDNGILRMLWTCWSRNKYMALATRGHQIVTKYRHVKKPT